LVKAANFVMISGNRGSDSESWYYLSDCTQ